MSIFSCKESVRLASESLDHDLSLGRRLALRFHLLLCPPCARYQRHLLFLSAAARRLEEQALRGEVESARLSFEARQRMKGALEQNNA